MGAIDPWQMIAYLLHCEPMRHDLAPSAGPGAVLQLIREGRATTRAELVALTGLSRATVAQRIDALLASGLIRREPNARFSGGRPSTTFGFDAQARVALAVDIGATHSRLAVTDLDGHVLAEQQADIDVAAGPEPVLDWVEQELARLLDAIGRSRDAVCGVGIGVPSSVDFATGRPVSPQIMPGWDGFPIPRRFEERYDVPVLVDNDVNVMALGEHVSGWRHEPHLLYVKVGTSIGCGLVANGSVVRGAQGNAGAIGHVRIAGHDDVVCHCGSRGCLEALVGGRALAHQLTSAGRPARNARDVVALARAHDDHAVRLVGDAGRLLGEALVGAAMLLNPGVLVIGGDLSHANEHLFAGLREVVYETASPLATRDLRIVAGALGDRAGIMGAAKMVIDHVLAPTEVDWALAET